ncbi:MAG: AI-2E family transporter, partial [Candidatus Neomarinimicrobiota bacterium]
PYLGPVVGAIPALVIAIITNPPNLLMVLVWIVVMFIVVQIIDNTMISPLVVSRSVNMHPLTVVAAVLIGGKVGGPLGMLFAVPIVGIFKVMLVELSWGLKKYRLS